MPNTTQLQALYAQIEEVCKHFKQIRSEASGIMEASQMPEATAHLQDVLHSSEQAAMTILEAATAVSYVTEGEGVSEDAKAKIAEQIGRIYEAASFQDISGQRIKKVLEHLSLLEMQLQRLSETAKGEIPVKMNDPLLNGPQLAAHAPDQDEIDRLFKSS